MLAKSVLLLLSLFDGGPLLTLKSRGLALVLLPQVRILFLKSLHVGLKPGDGGGTSGGVVFGGRHFEIWTTSAQVIVKL